MSGSAIVFLAYLAINAVSVVAGVGKRREPTTPRVAAGVVLVDIIVAGAIIWASR